MGNLKCPHCRSAWMRRENFDPRRYPDLHSGQVLALYANAYHLGYDPFNRPPRRQPTATVTSQEADEEETGDVLLGATAAPRPPSPAVVATEESDDDDDDLEGYYLDLELPEDDMFLEEEEEVERIRDDGRNYRAAEVITALDMHEGEIIDLEVGFAITLINGRLHVVR